MPTLQSYGLLGPFSLEELVKAANGLLRVRPRMRVSARTARYYVAQGIVSPPVGPPKHARYEVLHLARIVGVRLLQDGGASLGEAKAQLDGWSSGGEEKVLSNVQGLISLLHRSRRVTSSADVDSDLDDEDPDVRLLDLKFPDEVSVARIQVIPGVVVEIEAGVDREEAAEAIREILDLL